ncbi:hypothetical protein LINPERHAP2_LOCUS323, partial [Linum perenne]
RLDEAWRNEELFWGQRAKVNWLNLGDRNTKFFHASTMLRQQRNNITKLKSEIGHMTNFFKDLFRAPE